MTIYDLVREMERMCGDRFTFIPGIEVSYGPLKLRKKMDSENKANGEWRVCHFFKQDEFDPDSYQTESEACIVFLNRVAKDEELMKRYPKFNKNDLKSELDAAGIGPRPYSLCADVPDRFVLNHRKDGKWAVYYFDERGNQNQTVIFDSESEASLLLLNRVLTSIERLKNSRTKIPSGYLLDPNKPNQ